MTAAASVVWNEVRDAFPPVAPVQPVTRCGCDECRNVRANLGHLAWKDVLPSAIDKCFGSLPLMTDEAFRALLPAYLFHALADLSERNKVLEFTLYTLCPYDEIEELRTYWVHNLRARIRDFTAKQRAAVRSFLELVRGCQDLKDHHEAIAHAISAVWD